MHPVTGRVGVKPLSVNKAWQGRRFKSAAYTLYQQQVKALLPDPKPIGEPPYRLTLRYYFSNPASDIDNPTKPFQDILAKHYGFNDKQIYSKTVDKFIVPKGEDRIEYEIRSAPELRSRMNAKSTTVQRPFNETEQRATAHAQSNVTGYVDLTVELSSPVTHRTRTAQHKQHEYTVQQARAAGLHPKPGTGGEARSANRGNKPAKRAR